MMENMTVLGYTKNAFVKDIKTNLLPLMEGDLLFFPCNPTIRSHINLYSF